MEEKDYIEFCEKVNRYLNVNLLEYKENQMKRRLKTLYEKLGYKSFNEFFVGVQKDEYVRAEFLDRMTINVSEFFRNRPRWEVLEKEILPNLVKTKKKIKVWSAACSSGEEPYTLAMLLTKFYPIEQIEVLATDIDERIIEKAKKGIYNDYAVKGCPSEYLNKFFKKNDNEYVLDERIKKTVRFKKQDLLKDGFESDFDLIICRNVMIYFTEDAKEKLYHKFGAALAENGIFFVGSTEQIFQPQKFQMTAEKTFFYRKLGKG